MRLQKCEETTNGRHLEESPIQARSESATHSGFASLSSVGIKAGRNINALKLQRWMKTLNEHFTLQMPEQSEAEAATRSTSNVPRFLKSLKSAAREKGGAKLCAHFQRKRFLLKFISLTSTADHL